MSFGIATFLMNVCDNFNLCTLNSVLHKTLNREIFISLQFNLNLLFTTLLLLSLCLEQNAAYDIIKRSDINKMKSNDNLKSHMENFECSVRSVSILAH